VAKAYLADVGSTSGQLPRYIAWHDSWLKVPPVLLEYSAPPAFIEHPKAWGALSIRSAA
jgi:hypothetical protein